MPVPPRRPHALVRRREKVRVPRAILRRGALQDSRDGVARAPRKDRSQMPAEHATRIRRGEDADEMIVLRDQGTSDVLGGHVLEHLVEWLARIHYIRMGLEDVPHEQLILRRQSQIRVERALQVAVGHDTDERMPFLHG